MAVNVEYSPLEQQIDLRVCASPVSHLV